jgi:hypothetical protein
LAWLSWSIDLGRGVCNPNFFFTFSSWVIVRLHTKNQLDSLPGSASKVLEVPQKFVLVGCGWVVESK